MWILIIFVSFFTLLAGVVVGIKSNKNREQVVYTPEQDPDYEAFNHMMHRVHENNVIKGWIDDEPQIGNYIANIHGEVSQLWEAYRNHKLDTPCDKSESMHSQFGEIISFKEEEIADIIIRALDTAHKMGITNIGRAIRLKHQYNRTREFRHGGKAC